MKKLPSLLLLTVALLPSPSRAGVEAEVEVGPVFVGRNDTRIPGDGGSDLSLVDDLSTDAVPAFRVRLGYRIGERHLLSALVAPLRVQARGSVDRDIEFAGGTFPAGTPFLAVYRFDSYRLTYRYGFVRQEGLELAAGFTAKIRDAETSLYGVETRRKLNTGFVPLLSLRLAWRPSEGSLGLLLDVDALAAPQGRAEDVLLAATWEVREAVQLRLGYRTLEGGADNDEVYSFAWLHYAVMGLSVDF